MMVCFYYGATGLAAVWYFRKSWFNSVRNFFMRLLLPLLGGLTLVWMFVQTIVDSMDPDYGSGSSIGGLGLVFVLGVTVMALGVVLMVIMRFVSPSYFKRETLPISEHEHDKRVGVEVLGE